MKLVLGNLTELKVFLLNESLRSQTTWDDALEILGKGVGRRLEDFCNRKFERAVADTFEITADRMHVVLPRYPLEAAPAIELRDSLAAGYVAQVYNDSVVDHNLTAGLIKFGFLFGPSTSRLRFTFTGGFWVPDDDADEDNTDLPVGASLVPEALKLAWLLQCQRTWSVRDNLGIDVSGERAATFVSSTLAALELVPEVKLQLQPFIRQTLT